MRVSQAEKDKSHARIVAGAARLMRERGIEGASVADVMTHAGLTHGGFYRHFNDKEALLTAALESAFDEVMRDRTPAMDDADKGAGVERFRAFYLSEGHRNNPGIGCPVAALGAEVARGSVALKAAFGAGVNRMAKALERGMKGAPAARRAKALRELAMLAGAVMIARASDPETAADVLAACRAAPGIRQATR